MRLTNAGKFVILLLILGAAFGVWRVYQQFAPKGQMPGAPGGNSNFNGGPANSGNPGGGLEITIITSPTKKDWLVDQIDRFNTESSGKYHVTPQYVETREAMHNILEGKATPTLWSPSSPVWAARLGEAYEEKQHERILDTTDSDAFRTYLRSPIVLVTTHDKAAFLRPLLSGPDVWKNIASMGAGSKKVPWGRFRYAHADPITANSGFLTVSMMLLDYVRRNPGQTPEKAASSPGFTAYLRTIEKGLVFDAAAKKGSSDLMRAFAEDPTRYDVITNYESSALGALATNPDLEVIYPEPTLVSEQCVGLLNGAWVSPDQREGGRKFLAFLGGHDSLTGGITAHFRPAQGGGSLSLTPELTRQTKRGFKQSFTAAELPGYAAMNDAAYNWHQSVGVQ